MNRTISFIVFIFLLFSCGGKAGAVKNSQPQTETSSAQKQPAWILTPMKKDNEAFYTVGYSEDTGTLEDIKQKAFQEAKGRIANSIFEETSVSKIFETSGNLSSDEALKKMYQESVKSESAVQLVGVDIADSYSETTDDSGIQVFRVWVQAKISLKNLEKERARILSELQRKLALVDSNLKQAESYTEDGKASDALSSYITAAVSAVKVKERTDEIPIYLSKANQVLGNVFLEAAKNPDVLDIGKSGNLSFTVFYNNGKAKMPVSGAKVNFILRNNDGDYTRSAVSDDHGNVVCEIRKLKEVRNDNALYAQFSIDMDSILNLGKDYQRYYSTLRESAEKAKTYSEFKTISAVNRSIPTTVIAILNTGDSLNPIPNLASEAQAQLLTKGYKVIKFNESIPLNDIYQAKASALSVLAGKGIQRVLVLYVNSDERPKYSQELDRYLGTYSLSAQLIDTSNGEILSAKNAKLSATSPNEKGVFESFIKAAGRELSRLID